MRRLRLLDLWIFRGLFYIFVGLQTVDTNKIGVTQFTIAALSYPDNMVGFPIIISGLMYVLMGICCVKSVAESKRRKESNRYRELEDQVDSNIESV